VSFGSEIPRRLAKADVGGEDEDKKDQRAGQDKNKTGKPYAFICQQTLAQADC
jgi:hypothetical protein